MDCDGSDGSTQLQASLSKIRHHTNSKLENQKAPAQLLQAIESTLREQDATLNSNQDRNHSLHQLNPSPNEYFLALDSMIAKATDPKASPSLLQSVLYLLSLVAPHVSPSILRARLISLLTILSSVLSNPHPTTSASTDSQAALLRSVLTISQALFKSFTTSNDRASLEREMLLKGCWNSILNLCTDSRPKVRRRAQEIVGEVLLPDRVPTTISGKPHPYISRTAEWTIKTLESVSESGGVSSKKEKKDSKKGKNPKEAEKPAYDRKTGKATGQEEAARLRQLGQAGGDGAASTGIWVCGFAKALVGAMPRDSITSLCSVLLRLPGLQNPFLTVASFEVFEALLKSSRPVAIPSGSDPLQVSTASTSTSSPSSSTMTRPTLVSTISALRTPALIPTPSDIQLIPSYLKALEQALVSYSRLDGGEPCWDQYAWSCWTDVLALTLSSKSEASRNAPNVRGSGRDLLSAIVRYSIPDSGIEEALSSTSKGEDWKSSTKLGKIINSLEEAISKHVLRYQHSRKEILEILATLVSRLRYRSNSSSSPTSSSTRPPAAATILLLPLIKIIGDLRSQPNFEHREYADSVLGLAVEVCGPSSILSVLPLGLLGENGPTIGGRAWLLPLMRGRITNTELSHFIQEMLPLVEQLFNRKVEAEAIDEEGKPSRPVEAKVYEALVDQVWALFPGYCDMPIDLTQSFNSNLVHLLTNVLSSQSQLRPSIFKGLQNLVDRNEVLAKSSAPADVLTSSFGLSQTNGRENLEHLKGMTQTLLASFFDVFAQSPGESRGYVAEALSSYLRIASEKDLKSTFEKVINLLNQTLPELVPSRDRETGPGSVPPLPHTMLDLLIVLSPHLEVGKSEKSEANKLFRVAMSDPLLKNGDSGIQKKSYRILTRLVSGDKGGSILELNGSNQSNLVGELLSKLRGATASVVPGAKRDRIALLTALVPRIPSDEMHHLPSIIPEAVLGTKETNVGTRERAYELLVMMGEKMREGGKVKKNLVEGANKKRGEKTQDEDDDEDEAEAEAMDVTNDAGVEETDASIEEYITMVCAGLAGTSPHMISATLTSLARLLYSFHQDLPKETLSELIETLILFVSSTNREIVKASLGLSKVIILVLDTNLVDDHLPKLVPALLGWSKEHKQHFKSKVRHLFERLLRKFGFERIEQVTDEENRKLILNIKKRKERAKRRKAEKDDDQDDGAGEDEEDGMHAGKLGARALKNHGADAFEEAIYGSESEIDSEDEDAGADEVNGTNNGVRKLAGKAAAAASEKKSRKKNQNDEAYILEDDDAPLDLLDRSAVMGGMISTNSANKLQKNKRTPGKESSKFQLDEATGRMIIDDPDDPSSKQDGDESTKRIDGSGRAYLEKEQGLDGHTLGRGGAVKFNKNNKRTRNQEDEIDEMQIQDEEAEEQRLADLAAAASGAGSVDASKGRKKEKKQKKEKELLGAEFRSKKAKGDVMKDGKSPYAYVPLSQVGGKKKGEKSEVSLTGKGIKKQRK